MSGPWDHALDLSDVCPDASDRRDGEAAESDPARGAQHHRPSHGDAPGAREQPSSPQIRRIFLVGCPRSGTTFLQASLSKHPDILSLPETAFFERALPGRVDQLVSGFDPAATCEQHGFFEYLRAHRRAHRALRRVARELGELGWPVRKPGLRFSFTAYVDAFVRMLDDAAREHQCGAWLEKTPNHVFYLDVIQQHLPDARFIHLLRRGEDVIASAIEASLRYVGIGDGDVFCEGIPWWVACWNAAVAAHRRYAHLDNHCVVFYEDLVRDFAGEYARLCDFIGVSPIDQTHGGVVKRVARLEREPWKQVAISGKLIPAARKFEALFGPEAQRWIHSHLLPYDEVRAELTAAG
jgi:hypothetical protein